MRYAILIPVLLFILVALQCKTTEEKADTTKKAVIPDSTSNAILHLDTNRYDIPWPEDRFITKYIDVTNTGNEDLRFESITASCSCSNGRILNNPLKPGGKGKIMLIINTDGLDKEYPSVEFIIESNAKNSPVNIILHVSPKE